MSPTENDRDIILVAASRFLTAPGAAEKLISLPVANARPGPVSWEWISLPDWASDLVPKGKQGFFVPVTGGILAWSDVDWWAASAALLTCQHERNIEAQKGPLHSYAFHIGAEVQPAFDHAWVNRIVLFLRRWWCIENEADEAQVFGPIPKAVVHLTHDVDAVKKTLPIRAKQAAFSLYNKSPARAARFLFGGADYWQFDRILELERAYHRTSLWTFYGGPGGWMRSPRDILMDPAYQIAEARLKGQIRTLADEGHRIGLHPRFDTWRDVSRLVEEKSQIEEALGAPVKEIRQHWLRFSFAETWSAQVAAGLSHDLTLGFNDRPGFRAGAALSYTDAQSGMRVTPMVLMDSHLYDYANMAQKIREQTIDRILDELCETGGEASVIWHQRVFHADYGWGGGYEYLLDGLHRRNIAQPGVI